MFLFFTDLLTFGTGWGRAGIIFLGGQEGLVNDSEASDLSVCGNGEARGERTLGPNSKIL